MLRLTFTILTILLSSFALAEPPESKPGLHHHPLPDSGTSYGYLSFIPKGYNAKNGKHPLLISLHGQGRLGDSAEELDQVATNGPFKQIKKDPKIFNEAGCVVLGPQGLKADKWWKIDKLESFLEHALSHYAVDKDRVYLTGLSMGGGTCWKLADMQPETFAAIVPICGASRPPKDTTCSYQIPVWAFHCIDDPNVRFLSTKMWLGYHTSKSEDSLLEGYTKEGVQSASFDGSDWQWSKGQHPPKTIGITVYPERDHDSWTRAYTDPQLWEWLFEQKREP